ncbi:MAG: protein kinase [Chitinivibrionales bacterium]|nr:protein kinase [Chitinivibrionales bacterium]
MTVNNEEFYLPAVGERIGNLKITGTIASGGMSIVFKALHEELEVFRALKILKPGHKPESRKRIQTEAKIAANLKHPNIVQIYGASLWSGTLPYIEMEYVDGISAYTFIAKAGRVPWIVAASITAIVCRALKYAQERNMTVYGKNYQGLVHRDIKPANILLSNSGEVKLADFGIALPGTESIHTTGATVMGTAPYISPEQIDGKRLDRRTDIYSLGAVLYEMITGTKAFPEKAMSKLIRDKLQGSYFPVQGLEPTLPSAMVQAIDKSLHPEREKRFSSASEFESILESCIAAESDLPVDDIVSRYIKNREEKSVTQTIVNAGRVQSRKIFLPAVIVSAGTLLVLGILAFHFFKDEISSGPSSEGVSPAIKESIGKNKVNKGVPATKKSVRPRKEVLIDSVNDTTAAKEIPEHSEPKLDHGIKAFHKGDYRKAIDILQNFTVSQTGHDSENRIRLLLFESYLKVGDYKNAKQLSINKSIDDGYFYLLKGKLYHALGDTKPAEKYFLKAQSTSSIMGPKVLPEAVYFWALNRDVAYKKKPNVENRNKMILAWKKFHQAFCNRSGHASHCSEARERLKELNAL